MAASQIATRHFNARTRHALARKGIRIIGLTTIPDMSSIMPFANATTGYVVDDNGTSRVWSHGQVEAAACLP